MKALVLPYGLLSEPRVPNVQRGELDRAPSGQHLPLGLPGGSDPSHPSLASPLAVSPLAVSPTAPLGQPPTRPPPGDGCAGRARVRDAGDPEDLAPPGRPGQGRRRELFHPRPRAAVTLVPSAASLHPLRLVLLKTKPPLLGAERSPHDAGIYDRKPAFRGRLSRGPSPPGGPGPDAPKAASREPLTSRPGAGERSVRTAQARARRGGASRWQAG